MTREKAEGWVSTHNTARRIQAWAQAYWGQGPLHLKDLAHSTVLSFPTSPFLATHRASTVTLWTKSVAATGGKPGPELGPRPAEYGGPRNPFSVSFCLACQCLPQSSLRGWGTEWEQAGTAAPAHGALTMEALVLRQRVGVQGPFPLPCA